MRIAECQKCEMFFHLQVIVSPRSGAKLSIKNVQNLIKNELRSDKNVKYCSTTAS